MPSASMTATSPVRYQPSASNASAVASGRFEVAVEHRRALEHEAAQWFRRRAATAAPASSTSRVSTPFTGRPTQPGRRSPSARVLTVISDSVVPYRSTGCVAGEFGQPVEHRHRQCRTAGHQQPRRRQRRGGVPVVDDARPHRRHPEVQRTPRCGVTGGRRFSGVHEAISDPQRPEQPEHQTVHVEQRQAVHQGVVGRPLPRLRQARRCPRRPRAGSAAHPSAVRSCRRCT